MTENAVAQARTPTASLVPATPAPATPSATPATPTPSPTLVASDTPTPEASATLTLTPYPTLGLANFPLPPQSFAGDPHFYFRRPIGEGGNVFIASSYRYGSTYSHRFETHHGVEFANPGDTPLVAVAPGTIYHAGDDSSQAFGPQTNFYGHLIVLQLAEPWFGHTVYALYGHMQRVFVQSGQAVSAGDLLGTVGSTGIALGPHLHLEVRLDNPTSYWDTRNPELWLAPVNPNYGTVAVRVTNELGQYLPGMRVGSVCSDGAFRYVDTYWDPGVNPDDVYGENAALTDVPAGFCHFETTLAGNKIEATATVAGGGVTFVWLRP
jgi:murein DD-endopeptidase MepM/ murein hydrolase activator NlpD